MMIIPLLCFCLIQVSLAAQTNTPIWIQGDSVNRSCRSSKDCETEGARCFAGQCLCLTTHINVRGRCLPKTKPGQSPCQVDEQCTAVWPRTQCINSICQCDKSALQVRTRDGIVCMQEYESCPFGGRSAVLRDEQGSIARCEVNQLTGRMSGCLGQMHMYDCMQNSGGRNSKYFCCPNKASVCGLAPQGVAQFQQTSFQPQQQQFQPQQQQSSFQFAQPQRQPSVSQFQPQRTFQPQPTTNFYQAQQQRTFGSFGAVSSGRKPWYLNLPRRVRRQQNQFGSSQRWAYNALTATCQQFQYDGREGSANNFESIHQCENFCKTTCRRGSPQFERDGDGKITQFVQRQQMCNPATGCDDPSYECQILQPGRALCCPTVPFICSRNGGSPVPPNGGTPYDAGVFCSNNTRTVQRYYYDEQSRDCRTFSYNGCSGNHNRFMTAAECRNYCQNPGNQGLPGRLQDDPIGFPGSGGDTPLGDIGYEPTTFAPLTYTLGRG